MRSIVKSIGHGLFAAGLLLIAAYFLGAYFKGGDALREALNPLYPANYLALVPIIPGAILLWLGKLIGDRQQLSATDRPG